jgi:hypothetical protein
MVSNNANKKATLLWPKCLNTGSPTWTRTRDLRINSPSLYRLSYQGIEELRMIVILPCSVNLKLAYGGVCEGAAAELANGDDCV